MKAGLRIFEDSDAMSLAAAQIFVLAAARAIRARERFLVALSGGGAPSGLYRLLAQEPFRGRLAWDSAFVFWGDERCVPPDDPGSNYRQALDAFLGQVPIPDGNILRIRGELEPAQASEDYTQTLKRFAAPDLDWPRFDLALLGMGQDGHTASLFPGSPVEPGAPVLAVTAQYQDRPANRVTLTPRVFNSARKVLFLVTGAGKASTLKAVWSGDDQPALFPAQRIRPTRGTITWLLDEAAASKL